MEAISNIRDLVNLWPTRSSLAEDLRIFSPGMKVTTDRVYKWAENGAIPAKYHFAVLTAGRHRGFGLSADQIVMLHAPQLQFCTCCADHGPVQEET